MKKGDPHRLVSGYDDCANVCGRLTAKESNPEFNCKGADYRNERYLLVTMGANGVKSRKCVSNCSAAGDDT